jgi:hypothetical protein
VEHHFTSARGKRNLQMFVDFLRWSNVQPEFILKLAETHQKEGMNMQEF